MGFKGLGFGLVSFLFLDCSILPLGAQNVVTNGDFETGDLTGWTLTTDPANTDGPSAGLDNDPTDAFSGNDCVFFYNSDYMDQLSQIVSTHGGDTYTLTFELAANPSFTPDPTGVQHFQVFWDGNSVFDRTDTVSAPYQLITISNLTASDVSTSLTFSGQNEPGAYYLDDISLADDDGSIVGVPEVSTWAMSAAALVFLLARLIFRRLAVVRLQDSLPGVGR